MMAFLACLLPPLACVLPPLLVALVLDWRRGIRTKAAMGPRPMS